MKKMKTEDAVGQILCHDITQIVPGVTKDAVFRKGHVIREEDIPVLLSVGKDHIYIWENNENMLHENEAAEILYRFCGNNHMKFEDHAGEIKNAYEEITKMDESALMAWLVRVALSISDELKNARNSSLRYLI